MCVEEKIVRVYYWDLFWWKVFVKLELDVYNNIIVCCMFFNVYGWFVVKYIVDVYFSDLVVVRSCDEDEYLGECVLDFG